MLSVVLSKVSGYAIPALAVACGVLFGLWQWESASHSDTIAAWESEKARSAAAARKIQNLVSDVATAEAARETAERIAAETKSRVIIREVKANAPDCEDTVAMCVRSGLVQLFPRVEDSSGDAEHSAPTSLLSGAPAR